MTIDELLDMAQDYIAGADDVITTNGVAATADIYANISQACTHLAQAMMMRETGNERTVIIKTGETAISRGVTF